MTDNPSGQIKKPDRASGRKGVTILGKHEKQTGVTTESKTDGGSLETTVELGGPTLNERDADGRREFTDQ